MIVLKNLQSKIVLSHGYFALRRTSKLFRRKQRPQSLVAVLHRDGFPQERFWLACTDGAVDLDMAMTDRLDEFGAASLLMEQSDLSLHRYDSADLQYRQACNNSDPPNIL